MTTRHGHPKFYTLIEEICELHSRKNHDYATDENPLSNFRRSEAFGVPAWVGILVRMSDKWSRIEQLANGKTAQNESLRDSLIDLAAYALLGIILLEEQNGATEVSKGLYRSNTSSSVLAPTTATKPTRSS